MDELETKFIQMASKEIDIPFEYYEELSISAMNTLEKKMKKKKLPKDITEYTKILNNYFFNIPRKKNKKIKLIKEKSSSNIIFKKNIN